MFKFSIRIEQYTHNNLITYIHTASPILNSSIFSLGQPYTNIISTSSYSNLLQNYEKKAFKIYNFLFSSYFFFFFYSYTFIIIIFVVRILNKTYIQSTMRRENILLTSHICNTWLTWLYVFSSFETIVALGNVYFILPAIYLVYPYIRVFLHRAEQAVCVVKEFK